MISLNDIRWAAGFLEGEGNFGFYSKHLRVAATQVQKEPLERLKRMFGGPIKPKHQSKNPRASRAWRWTFSNTKGVSLMMTLYDLMSTKRKAQISAALKAWKSIPRRPQYRTHCPKGHTYSVSNTYARKNGGRLCRKCCAERNRNQINKHRLRERVHSESQLNLSFLNN